MLSLPQEVHFDQYLLQPGVIVPDWHAFASEYSQAHIVHDVLHQEDDAVAASTENTTLDEVLLEVARVESIAVNPSALRRRFAS